MLASNKIRYRTRRTNKGFSLIELMVVMTIMVGLLSLVGPLAVRNVESTQYKAEEKQFKNWLLKLSHIAFYSGQPVSVSVTERSAVATIGPEQEVLAIEYLDFPAQQIRFTKNGYPTPTTISYRLNQELIEMDLVQYIYVKDNR